MTNEFLLNKKIAEVGKKKRYLAEKCGMTYACFYNCIKNKAHFNAEHIAILCVELKIKSLKEKEDIFFSKQGV